MRLGRALIAVVQAARLAHAAAFLLAREGRNAVIARLMRGEGHARQAVQAGPAEGHQAKKRPVHDRDAGVFQAFVHGAQNDLALFVLNAERRQTEHGVYVVDTRIGRVEQVGRFGGDVPRLHAPHTADLLDGRRLVAVQYLNVGQCGELLQKPALEYLRIVGVLGGQERAVAEARVEVALGRNVVAADACVDDGNEPDALGFQVGGKFAEVGEAGLVDGEISVGLHVINIHAVHVQRQTVGLVLRGHLPDVGLGLVAEAALGQTERPLGRDIAGADEMPELLCDLCRCRGCDEAERIVRLCRGEAEGVVAKIDENLSVEEIIKQALKILSRQV